MRSGCCRCLVSCVGGIPGVRTYVRVCECCLLHALLWLKVLLSVSHLPCVCGQCDGVSGPLGTMYTYFMLNAIE